MNVQSLLGRDVDHKGIPDNDLEGEALACARLRDMMDGEDVEIVSRLDDRTPLNGEREH